MDSTQLELAKDLATHLFIRIWNDDRATSEFTTLIVLALLGIGVNSLGIGVLGEYLGRTYAETKRRPLYVIADSVNLSDVDQPIDGVRISGPVPGGSSPDRG